MKKSLTLLLTIMMLLFAFSACSPSQGPDVATNSPGTEASTEASAENPTATAEAQEPVKLTFLCNEQPQLPREFWQTVADKYMAAHENVDIELIFQPSANISVRDYEKTLLATDQFPDIMVMASPGDFVPSGALLPFDDEDLTPIREDYISRIDGKAYVLPYKIQVGGMFYNKKIFEENGLSVPSTWDEFIAVCDALKAKNITPLAMGVKDGWPQVLPFFMLQTVDLLGSDYMWPAKRMAGETTFANTPAFVNALKKYDKLCDEYMPADRTSITYTQTLEMFYGGKAAMFPMGSWTQGDEASMDHDFEVGFFPVPSENGDKIMPLWTNEGLAISATTKYPEVAKDFAMFFLTDPEFAASFLKIEQLFTPLKDNIEYEKTELHREIEAVLADCIGISEFYDTVGDNTWYPGVQALYDGLSLRIASDPNTDLDAEIANLDSEFDLIIENQ